MMIISVIIIKTGVWSPYYSTRSFSLGNRSVANGPSDPPSVLPEDTMTYWDGAGFGFGLRSTTHST